MEILNDELEARYRLKTTKELIALTLEDITPSARTVVEKELVRRKVSDKQRQKLDQRAEKTLKRQIHASETLAPLWKRYIAITIDGLVGLVLFTPIAFLDGIQEPKEWVLLGLALLFTMIYNLAADALPQGQSLGKKLLGLTVIDTQKGGPCTLGQSLGRNFSMYILSFIDLFPLVGKQRRRIGDILAATSVRRVER